MELFFDAGLITELAILSFLSRCLTVLLGKVMLYRSKSIWNLAETEIKTFNINAVGITKLSGESYHSCII